MENSVKISLDIIIVGSGPAGIQLGYYFNKLKKEYLILEKGTCSGSFFTKFPHSKELISINKKYTGSDDKEFNLRHDWNSLLNEYELQMTNFSDDFYPDREDLVQYLNTFSQKHKIKIAYNTIVKQIDKTETKYILKCERNNKQVTFIANQVIMATGLSKMNYPSNFINIKQHSKHYGEYSKNYFVKKENLEKYKNKTCLIIGSGNSAYELANILNNLCSSISIYSFNTKLSFMTHYSGHLRSKYLSFYDTFYLKSLNAMYNFSDKTDTLHIKQKGDKKHLYYICGKECDKEHTIFHHDFDFIINCTGWKFDNSIFGDTINQPYVYNKYPMMNSKYESSLNKNLFYIGALMHAFDWQISSGGFIHGFRYLIDNFVKINYTDFEYKVINNLEQLAQHFINRINKGSDIYQMFGQLGDIFYYKNGKFHYYEGIPLTYFFSTYNTKINIDNDAFVFIVTLEYGKDKISDINKIGKGMGSLGYENKSLLLHPVIRVFKNIYKHELVLINHTNLDSHSDIVDVFHFIEDLFAIFSDKAKYNDKFQRIIKSFC